MTGSVAQRRLRRPEYWLSLAAVCFISIFFYGLRAAAVIGLAAVTALLTDFFCLFLQKKSYKMVDLSNAAAAMVMVLMFPATIPYSIVILSTVFAVAVGIHVFGSRKDYLFPPAAVGYLFALLCWKDEVLTFPMAGEPLALFGNSDIIRQESLSSELASEGVLSVDVFDLLIGAVQTPMGTGCLLLLMLVLVVLIVRKCVSYWACLGFIFGISVLSAFGTQPVWEIFAANMLLFSMIFLIGDKAMMPEGKFTQLLGSMVTGLLTYYLLTVHHLEYAVVIAVLLSCPVWHALAAWEEGIDQRLKTREALSHAEKTQTMPESGEETEAAE